MVFLNSFIQSGAGRMGPEQLASLFFYFGDQG